MGKAKTEGPRKAAVEKKHKVIPPKKLIEPFKAPNLRHSSRRLEKMPEKTYRAAVELGYRQPTMNMHGGVGIPGKRTKDAVQKLAKLDFAKLDTELPAILRKSEEVRGNKDIKQVRKEVQPINRQVVYRPGAPDVHSLHVANDIAAVSNSRSSKVYDYPDLAPKLDKRLHANNDAKGKKYFDNEMKVEDRRSHVGQGLQHLIAGDIDKAQAAFDNAGLTEKGRKWAHKMGTLMLAERARELHGGGGADSSKVSGALDHVKGGRSFEDVFVKHAAALAPFAMRGGAKTLK